MPTKEQQRQKLIALLKRLFQLDQPDLDFGFYRIMHAKAEQITEFLDRDLLGVIEDAFGTVDESKKARLKTEYEQELKTAKEYGAVDPENAPKVMEALAKYEAALQTEDGEGEIYDHLYRFFERYYDNGDFISRRYYTRETSGKAAPFAIPYNGEEVKLVWANMDQYYIKTSEYFTNFTFDLTQSKEAEALRKEDSLGLFKGTEEKPRRVHFRVVGAAEGEHGNVKASENEKRYFIIHREHPVSLDENRELVINFEYRPDPEKGSSQEGTWRERRNAEAVETVLNALDNLSRAKKYRTLLKIPAPTDKQKNRPLLAKYINQYTARNTMDYFIHKDLGSFLRRELDFYIKNEVMRLDDIENADVPTVETYLARIKVLRRIAGKLIDFLAQLENFQKKLWLKKKFVVETNYCITLDKLVSMNNDQSSMNRKRQSSINNEQLTEESRWLLEQVVANRAQWCEWQKMGFVQLTIVNPQSSMNSEQLTDEEILAAEDFTIIFNGEPQDDGLFAEEPLTYRKVIDNCSLIIAHWNLVLDTKFFAEDFKVRLTATIEDFDEQCDGLLIHSENLQALNLLQGRYREQVKCVYIDPPYNAQSSEILYKNTYKHASWLSLIQNSIQSSKLFLTETFVHITAIDEVENMRLSLLFSDLFPNCEDACISIIHNPTGQQGNNFSFTHEFAHFVYPQNRNCIGLEKRDDPLRESTPDIRPLRNVSSGKNHLRESAANCFYPILIKDGRIHGFGEVCEESFHPQGMNVTRSDGIIEVYPIDPSDVESKWVFARNTVESIIDELSAEYNPKKKTWDIIRRKSKFRYKSLWEDKRYSANSWGSVVLNNLLTGNQFTYPKSIYTVRDCIDAGLNNSTDGLILDYFAGSGTTTHAVINLNREDGGTRKYILVEMGDYFDTVLKPRIAKVVYSENWKDGKPTTRHTGISHCFKYLRLESYEDALNNLRFEENETRDAAITANSELREDYMLHYLLDVETRGSQSILNIDAFTDPTAYTLKIKKPGSDEHVISNVDLIETFNYLIGLRVTYIDAPQSFTARFKRETDPDLPDDQETRLVIDGKLNH